MARVASLNMLLETTGTDYLAELYGKVIENISAQAVSIAIKNQDLSGDPESGSVEAKRFSNATAKAYGTARTAGHGDGVVARPVPVLVDTDKEIIEELQNKDIRLYGVEGLIERRANNHVQVMISTLDTAFFAEAVNSGTEFTPTESATVDQVEETIQAVESTKNAFVDGVPRELISVVCTPKVYGDLRKYLQSTTRQNIVTGLEDQFYEFNGCKCFKSNHLPADCEFIVMVDGAVAQPVVSDGYQAERVPQSNAYSLDLFFSYGTKAVTPDLIQYVESGE